MRAARLAAALVPMLAGCAAQLAQWKAGGDDRIADIRDKRLFDLSRSGVAFMSLGGSAGKCVTGTFSIFFRPVRAGTPEMRFHAVTSNLFGVSNAVIRAPQSCVEVVGMSLPPGTYQITRATWSADLGTMQQSLQSDRFASTRFTVRAGEVAYLGSFQMVFRYTQSALGKPVLAGGEYGVTDELNRDLKKLAEVRPDLAGLPLKAQLPREHVGAAEAPRAAHSR
jgi:hypothetical protein